MSNSKKLTYTNHLISETSPYLLQHAHNPVDWYPWGDEALTKAKIEDKPILLSIGYSACHWCHRLREESFEDPAIAAIMNQYFINIKVDREERPDIDSIYMNAVVLLNNGQGGWPLTAFLTPEGKPFYGGTYFPPTPRYGMPSFRQLLDGVANFWHNRRDEVEKSVAEISQHLQQNSLVQNLGQGQFEDTLFEHALSGLLRRFDQDKGGFGQAPKFPPSMTIEFLLRMYLQQGDDDALYMAEHTLKMMAYGGMYDQLGGGFARYSTDNDWLVPHFEKMLYDNALLARVYLHAWQVTGKPLYRRIVEETLDFVVAELRDESGGFYSSYDADSEGEEGRFYVWSAVEIEQLLNEDADLFMVYYDVTEGGNWEGHNILNMKRDPEEVAAELDLDVVEMEEILAAARARLYDLRAERVWPGLDDKVLTAWNGLMLAAFAEAGRILKREDYTEIAEQNAAFLYETMRGKNGRLLRTWKADGNAKYNAYLEDYAYLADGLLALYQNTFAEKWFIWARELAEMMLTHFTDEQNGGFYDTSDDHEDLFQRPKDIQDNATPSANAMAAQVLLKLSLYTGDGRTWDIAEQMTASMSEWLVRAPTGFSHWLCAAAFIMGEPQEIAIAGIPGAADTQALLEVVNSEYRPNVVVAVGTDGEHVELLRERPLRHNQATAYVCRRFICQQPVTEPEALRQQLGLFI
jgi:uncharacterized protein YyaL (SSP411 family)